MSRSKKAKLSRPRSGIQPSERRIEHRRHRARVREELQRAPERVPKRERFADAGDIWNWD